LVGEGGPLARVTRFYREVIAEGAPAARVTRGPFREVLGEGAPAARVTRGPFREIIADNPVLVIAQFIGGDDPFQFDDDWFEIPDDELAAFIAQFLLFAPPSRDEFTIEEEWFDYDGDDSPLIVLSQSGLTFIFSADDEELVGFEDAFDYDGDDYQFLRRRRIPGQVFFA
jgi:hypothetical protein